MTSTRPKPQQLAFDFSDEVVSPDSATSELQPEQSRSAAMEKPALDSVSLDLMERIVDDGNLERAWKKVKANRGAPGPDGIAWHRERSSRFNARFALAIAINMTCYFLKSHAKSTINDC